MKYTGWLFLFAIAVAIAAPTLGGDYGDGYSGHRHHYNRNRCATDFWGNCTYVAHNRYAYRWRYYHSRFHRYRRYGDGDSYYSNYYFAGSRERIDHGLQCHACRRVIGEEKSSRARAQRAADNAWMGSVRYDHGERYQDMNYAKDVRHNCGPSSTTTILKRTFFRCSVEATPCRAPLGETTRVERKYEEDTPDEDDR